MEAVDHEKKIRTASLPILRPDIEHTAKVSLTTRGEMATLPYRLYAVWSLKSFNKS